jgi:hypothetical protein
MTHSTLQERIKLVPGGAVINADIRTQRISSYLPMKDYGRVAAVLTTAAVTASKTATLQILQAKDDLGTDAKNLVTTTSGTLGGVQNLGAEASQDEMDGQNGFTHVAVRMVSNNDAALLGACILFRSDAAYKPVARID